MRTLEQCRCERAHRSAAAWLHCAVPALTSVSGVGCFAIVLWCSRPRAHLFHSEHWARTVHAEYGVFGCGPDCVGEHELVRVPDRLEEAA